MLKKIWNSKKNKKGFTLVELMVVVAIIAILIAIAVPIYNNITTQAQTTACQANQRSVDSAVMQYFAANGSYPTAVTDLTTGTMVFMKADGVLCPKTGTAYTLSADSEAVCADTEHVR